MTTPVGEAEGGGEGEGAAEGAAEGEGEGEDSRRAPRFAYLILTHKDIPDVEELAERIVSLSPSALVVVHHDSEAPGLPWGGHPPEPFHLVERMPVRWGEWSMIQATGNLVRYAVEELDAGWFVLLSGEHRPAVDLARWEREVAASGADALVRADELPARLRFGWRDFEANRHLARGRHHWRLVPRPLPRTSPTRPSGGRRSSAAGFSPSWPSSTSTGTTPGWSVCAGVPERCRVDGSGAALNG